MDHSFPKKGREKRMADLTLLLTHEILFPPRFLFPLMFTLYFVNCKKGMKNDDITTH